MDSALKWFFVAIWAAFWLFVVALLAIDAWHDWRLSHPKK
jgi:hypothetical protein